MDRQPKILLLGDYSNCHKSLAGGLNALGCDVVVASDGSRWLDCQRDVDLTRVPGKIGGFMHWLRQEHLLRNRLGGFDIVAVNDPMFASLKPALTKRLFNLLRQRNGSVFLTSMSTDLPFLDMLEAKDSPLRYSEWFIDGQPSRNFQSNRELWQSWHARQITDYQNYFFDKIDGAVSVLYEYHQGIQRRLGPEKAAYGGIPIQTELFRPVELPESPGRVRLFLGRDRNRMLEKGSDLLEVAAKRIVEKYPNRAELVIVENRPYSEFTELLRSAHVVLDQIYSYTPATTALMAMAYGLNVVSGGEPEFYSFIGEQENHPVINAPIEFEPLCSTLEQVVLHPEEIRARGLKSREFVVKHNDSRIVARRFLDFWNERRVTHT